MPDAMTQSFIAEVTMPEPRGQKERGKAFGRVTYLDAGPSGSALSV